MKKQIYSKIKKYESVWVDRCYFEGLPDFAPTELEESNKAPSYRAICKCILKNDLHLTGIGFTRKKSIWYSRLKKIEIDARANKKQIEMKLRNNFQDYLGPKFSGKPEEENIVFRFNHLKK